MHGDNGNESKIIPNKMCISRFPKLLGGFSPTHLKKDARQTWVHLPQIGMNIKQK